MTRHAEQPIARFNDTAMRADVLAYMSRWKVSQRGIARSIGMSEGTICRWFRGEGRLGLDFAASLAICCDLSLDAYVTDRDSVPYRDPDREHAKSVVTGSKDARGAGQ